MRTVQSFGAMYEQRVEQCRECLRNCDRQKALQFTNCERLAAFYREAVGDSIDKLTHLYSALMQTPDIKLPCPELMGLDADASYGYLANLLYKTAPAETKKILDRSVELAAASNGIQSVN